MKLDEGKIIGILGTIIVHLIIAILFMAFKLQGINKVDTDNFVVEFLPSEAEEEEEKPIELPLSAIEKIFEGDENMLNIARNLANRPDINVDPNEYIDMVKDELIKNGLLDENNFIDAQKKLEELAPEEIMALENTLQDNEPTELNKIEANYQGPTRIYYELEGRTHTYLPIPIYKCEGSGLVVLSIQVDQKGLISNVSIIGSQSTTTNQCLIETAIEAAKRTRFNSDLNAPKAQTGTITYNFVAQ